MFGCKSRPAKSMAGEEVAQAQSDPCAEAIRVALMRDELKRVRAEYPSRVEAAKEAFTGTPDYPYRVRRDPVVAAFVVEMWEWGDTYTEEALSGFDKYAFQYAGLLSSARVEARAIEYDERWLEQLKREPAIYITWKQLGVSLHGEGGHTFQYFSDALLWLGQFLGVAEETYVDKDGTVHHSTKTRKEDHSL